MDTDDTYNLECMKLPLSLIIDLKEINQGNRLASYTKSIVRKKKSTTEGHAVLDKRREIITLQLTSLSNSRRVTRSNFSSLQCLRQIALVLLQQFVV